jgi:hypothetical protein
MGLKERIARPPTSSYPDSAESAGRTLQAMGAASRLRPDRPEMQATACGQQEFAILTDGRAAIGTVLPDEAPFPLPVRPREMDRALPLINPLLGTRVFRIHGGTRSRGNPELHPAAGARRQTAGSVEPGNLRRPPAGGQDRRGLVSVPAAALSGPTPKAPGSAGG